MDENILNEDLDTTEEDKEMSGDSHKTVHLSGMYENWFLDYASYVILERAVPDIDDGLKPVQRRLMHSMKDLDDGRYNKVANIIGHTMKYHPHGDASIGDALVQLGQKDLLVDTQGNWGNVLTGDRAAAPRYIEARLSKFALDILFNEKTTNWKLSYDGRNKEPMCLPVKFPLLLAQGVEGIAVGLASKILPHNFVELIDASISYLRDKGFELYPDFLTGGHADFSKYNDGIRGGKVRVRAKISQKDKKTLVISEIPFGTTTTNLIESILVANDKGKIKIKKIDDNTARNVEILIYLSAGVSPDQTIDALYAFTNCEVSISPNSCVIQEGKPVFLGVREMLKRSADNTVLLLKNELEIRKEELLEHWHFASLERIFIEERIYRNIEKCTTWEAVIKTIDDGLTPFKDNFKREITKDDIIRLTEIKIKRISKFSSFKADELISRIESEIEEVDNHLNHLVDFTINYYKQIKKKYSKGKERKTEIRNFDTIRANMVAAANQRLYINREEGFIGTGLKKDEFVCECSDIDDVIAFKADGTFIVNKVANKVFIGKDIIHVDVFKKNDDRTIYNMIYRDGTRGNTFVKRFAVLGVTRDKEYNLTKGTDGSKVMYFTANPNGEAEILKIYLRPKARLKKLSFDYDFSELAIKGRNSKGNTLTKHSIKSIIIREEGVSTLGARDIWYDDIVKRLNTDERGKYLGAFKGDDKILTIMKSGTYKLISFDLTTHFDEDLIIIEKFDARTIFSVIYFEGDVEKTYLKRFQIEQGSNGQKKVDFIGEHPKSKLIDISLDYLPILSIDFDAKANMKELESEKVNVEEFIGVKSYKAKGKRLSNFAIKKLKWLEPLPYVVEEVIEEELEEEAVEVETKGETKTSMVEKESANAQEEDNIKESNKEEDLNDGGEQMTLGL